MNDIVNYQIVILTHSIIVVFFAISTHQMEWRVLLQQTSTALTEVPFLTNLAFFHTDVISVYF